MASMAEFQGKKQCSCHFLPNSSLIISKTFKSVVVQWWSKAALLLLDLDDLLWLMEPLYPPKNKNPEGACPATCLWPLEAELCLGSTTGQRSRTHQQTPQQQNSGYEAALSSQITDLDPAETLWRDLQKPRLCLKILQHVWFKTVISRALDYSCCRWGWHNQLLACGGNYCFSHRGHVRLDK